MSALVLDAGTILNYLLADPIAFDAVLRAPDTEVHLPFVCDVELTSGLRRKVRFHEVTPRRAREVLNDYVAMPAHRHTHVELLPRIFDLRDNFSAYDATYVALAERLVATFVTHDGRLARAVRAHTRLAVRMMMT
jgi:predicted nucleic acid-binding protein